MHFKLVTLVDNSLEACKTLESEHGLSFFIEIDGPISQKLLFDTGQSEKFIKNAAKLDVSLGDMNKIILSHAHFDHSGGLRDYIAAYGNDFELLVGDGFFREKFDKINGDWKYLGNNFTETYLQENSVATTLITEDVTEISPGMYIVKNFPLYSFEKMDAGSYICAVGTHQPDLFEDEVIVVLEADAGLVVLVGCSHRGIINILREVQSRFRAPIHCVLGGTHLVNGSKERVEGTIKCLQKLKIPRLGLCHCTGSGPIGQMAQELEGFFLNATGTVLIF